MAKSLVRAAVAVLSETGPVISPHVDPREALMHSVSLFLRSLQHFPRLPLSFALVTYRDFFVLVARWRSEDHAEDARHTIDRARRWLEQSTAEQREALDRHLVTEPWFWGGPCGLTSRLLGCLIEQHSGWDCMEEITDISLQLLDSLEVAHGNAKDDGEKRCSILRLLAILVEALVELKFVDSMWVWEQELVDSMWVPFQHEPWTVFWERVAKLFVNSVWRAPEACANIAVGILYRLRDGDAGPASWLANTMSYAIIDRLESDLHCPHNVSNRNTDCTLSSMDTLFQACLDKMDAMIIEEVLLEPLSTMMSFLLERTTKSPGDEYLAELDALATRLYNICEQAMLKAL